MILFRCGNNGGSAPTPTPTGNLIAVECPNGVLPEEWRETYTKHPNAFTPVCNGNGINTINVHVAVANATAVESVTTNASVSKKIVTFDSITNTIKLSGLNVPNKQVRLNEGGVDRGAYETSATVTISDSMFYMIVNTTLLTD